MYTEKKISFYETFFNAKKGFEFVANLETFLALKKAS
jgi:hypothetical protein